MRTASISGKADGARIGAAGARPASKAPVALGLFRAVLRGEWKPGKRLVEEELAERFGVSRTPVREALFELEGLGVVESRRNRGAVLLPFGPREVRELYEVRSILEVEATRSATGSIGQTELHRLRAAFLHLRELGAADEGWKLDRELHRAIAEASGNRRLAGEIFRYGNLVQAVRESVGELSRQIHALTVEEHIRIVDSLLGASAAAAAEAMSVHLRQAADSAVSAVEALRD